MTFIGMDIDDVDHIVTQLGGRASAIQSMLGEVDRVVGALLGGIWAGPDVEEFHNWWLGSHRPSVNAAHEHLANMVTELRQQVQAQLGVSGEAGSGSGGSVLPPPGSRTMPSHVGGSPGRGLWSGGGRELIADAYDRLDKVNEGLGIAGALTGSATYLMTHQLVGRYPNGTIKAFWNSSNFFRWKTSPTAKGLQSFLTSHPGIAKFAPDIEKGVSKLDGFSNGMSIIGAATNGVEIGKGIAKGDWLNTALDSAHAGADIAKTSKNPVAYLSGAATQSLIEVGKQARNVDWSASGFTTTMDYVKKDFWGSVQAGVSADVHYLPGALGRIFG